MSSKEGFCVALSLWVVVRLPVGFLWQSVLASACNTAGLSHWAAILYLSCFESAGVAGMILPVILLLDGFLPGGLLLSVAAFSCVLCSFFSKVSVTEDLSCFEAAGVAGMILLVILLPDGSPPGGSLLSVADFSCVLHSLFSKMSVTED